MTEIKQVILPITGMTCANCVASVERSLKKDKAVQSAQVNLSSERAMVEYDPLVTTLTDLVVTTLVYFGLQGFLLLAFFSIKSLRDTLVAMKYKIGRASCRERV